MPDPTGGGGDTGAAARGCNGGTGGDAGTGGSAGMGGTRGDRRHGRRRRHGRARPDRRGTDRRRRHHRLAGAARWHRRRPGGRGGATAPAPQAWPLAARTGTGGRGGATAGTTGGGSGGGAAGRGGATAGTSGAWQRRHDWHRGQQRQRRAAAAVGRRGAGGTGARLGRDCAGMPNPVANRLNFSGRHPTDVLCQPPGFSSPAAEELQRCPISARLRSRSARRSSAFSGPGARRPRGRGAAALFAAGCTDNSGNGHFIPATLMAPVARRWRGQRRRRRQQRRWRRR